MPRKRTPTAILRERGSWRAAARAKTEPVPPEGKARCPSWLRARAKRRWQQHARQLSEMQVLTPVDGAALARYCQLWARWREVEDDLAKNGQTTVNRFGEPIARPGVRIANALAVQLRGLEQELGLTPSARARLQVDTLPPERDELDIALAERGDALQLAAER